jgi:Peptidase family M28
LDSPGSPRVRRILSSAVILAAILALSFIGLRPPRFKPDTAPATEFSAVRALAALHRILKDDTPHPIGSAANEAVRGRILDELTQLGYHPQVQTVFECGQFINCATVNNILARLDGSDGDPDSSDSVLLSAHYDSVPAGPGDSDDGTGTAAVIEVARALKSLPPPRHSIVLLIDDGEEAGLLGARAFVDFHPWAKTVRAAVNLDARGTSGPSLMFETGSANDWVVRLFAHSARHPATTSIAYALYKMLPNDTDFTTYRAAGYQGLNFAYLGSEPHYHTALDNSANVSLYSLQHHGENALPAIVALANSDFKNLPQREAVFFDIFGRVLVHWPASRSLPVAWVVMLLLLAQIAWMIRNNRLSVGEFLWGMLAWLVTMIVTGVLAFIVERLIHLAGGTPVDWVAYPEPINVAFWALAVTVVTTHALLFTSRARFWGLWAGTWTWWALIAILVSWQSPAMSYVALVPAAVAALAGLAATLRRSQTASGMGAGDGVGAASAAIVPLAAVAIVAFAPALLLYSALGNRGLVLISLLVGFIGTPLAPLCSDLRGVPGLRGLAIPWLPILVMALGIFAAIVVPAYSAKAPERVNFDFVQDADSGNAQWIVQPDSGRLPEPIRLAATFRGPSRGAFPWDSHATFVSEAPHLDLAPPTFTILEVAESDARRNYRTLLRSERGAPYAAILFPPGSGVDSVRVGGQPVEPLQPGIREYFNGWTIYACPAMPAGGVEIGFSVPLGKPVEVSAADQSYGLPPDGAFLAKSRPLTATPSQNGDVTIISRRVQLLP